MTVIRRMLVIEDEALISMMLEDFLDVLDIEVAGSAASVEEAMSLVRSVQADAVILDLNLRDGERSDAVADELTSLGIPFIVSSGASFDVPAGRPVLPKPFSLDALQKAISAL